MMNRNLSAKFRCSRQRKLVIQRLEIISSCAIKGRAILHLSTLQEIFLPENKNNCDLVAGVVGQVGCLEEEVEGYLKEACMLYQEIKTFLSVTDTNTYDSLTFGHT